MLDIPCIQVDLPCIECEYNLRGLSSEGKCPECGRPINDSLRVMTMPLEAPRSLRAVAALFIFQGMLAVAAMAFSFTQQKPLPNAYIAGVFIGSALLRLTRGSRTWALFLLWLQMAGLLLAILLMLLMPKWLGLPLRRTGVVIVTVSAVLLLLCCWQYWVLTRPKIRSLFKLVDRRDVELKGARDLFDVPKLLLVLSISVAVGLIVGLVLR
ncbi:MAG: hypothetical protein AMXMBFR13_28720 [Phycisphaerae bacterium]